MKFTDGYWQMRKGYIPYFAAQAYDVTSDERSMTVYAPTRVINHRGDTLNLPMLTLRYSSPMEGIIRVQVEHHKGGKLRGPQFQLNETMIKPEISISDKGAEFKSGELSAKIQRGDTWYVTFQAGEQVLTHSDWHCLGYVDTPDGRFIHEQLNLGVGEYVYGLGERFTPFIKNGQVVDIWNEDGGTASEQAYKNIPFYLTNRGYGVFVNHPERVSFEVGSEKVERVQFSVPGEKLDYFVIYGPTPKQVLERYTALTGRPALPPAWSFGLWLSTSFTTNYDEETITGFIREMEAHKIPLHVFHFDCFWMREFNWCDFIWDEGIFPDPAGMLKRLKEQHSLHICVWINPYIAQRSVLFDEAMEHGYLIKRPNGDVWQWDMWQAGMGIVDFTNPDACKWFAEKLNVLMDMGVDAFKTDFGECIPTDVVWFEDSDPQKMHNYYTQLYNQTVYDAIKAKRGESDAIVFARSATVGGQQFPVHWGGDCTATFESMAESLRGGLSLHLSGFGFWSHDIGGFEQTASADVYKRWAAFGLLSSHSRLHGSSSYRVPWVYDEEAVEVLAKFTRMKASLMPYIYQTAVQAHQFGIPTLRAMMLAFPGDPACETLDRQYMLGDSLLVAPVLREDSLVDYYLPAGKWTNFLTDEVVEGGKWRQDKLDYMSIPLWVAENSVIPVGARDDRPDYDYEQDVTLHVFQFQDGVKVDVVIPDTLGNVCTIFHCKRKGDKLKITRKGVPGKWNVMIRGGKSKPISVDGNETIIEL